jgi:8-oxo-dGTP pyrophosphatase MutT (NUDIX family)
MRKFPNAWVLPGGHIEPFESMETSVIREVEEETGIKIDTSKDSIEPFFIFESVSMCADGITPPSSGHLIIFYKV